MRDGVSLYTVLLAPLKARNAPILLTRTPYGADAPYKRGFTSPMLAANMTPMWADLIDAGYIIAIQDVRGKYKSEGDYVLYRAPGDGDTDHVSDTWDTVEWLSHNVADSNGRVGILGVSYPGWLSAMPLLNAHPALRAAVPINPVIDAWIGDDFYHNGAFRLFELEYFYKQTATRDSSATPAYGHYDVYAFYLEAGNAERAMRAVCGKMTLPAWERMARNTVYDAQWQAGALDRSLARIDRLPVPTLNVHAWYDAEDNYGAPAAHAALAGKPGAPLHFVAGPWMHGQCFDRGAAIGPIQWDADTALQFRREHMLPFLETHLKDAPARPAAPVTVFETGRNRWHAMPQWPPRDAQPLSLYLGAGQQITFEPPAAGAESYISDPAKPIPFRVRPIISRHRDYANWGRWLADDQRPFADRPDVLVFSTPPLEAPVTLAGAVSMELFASTTGSDADWVIKLIDAYPDEYPRQPELGGYQLMVSADILRGRFRERYDVAAPIPPGVQRYEVRMPHLCHTFRAGHRIMMQVQSTWFPLYDRNPQTFVESIYDAPAAAYRAQTHTIHFGGASASRLRVSRWVPG